MCSRFCPPNNPQNQGGRRKNHSWRTPTLTTTPTATMPTTTWLTLWWNGFNMASFIVADGLRGENYRTVPTKGILKEIEVSGAIAEADAMIVVSHDKGHELSGFGGCHKEPRHGLHPGSRQTSPAQNSRIRDRYIQMHRLRGMQRKLRNGIAWNHWGKSKKQLSPLYCVAQCASMVAPWKL